MDSKITLIKGESVSKNFGGLVALHNINFSVNKGEIFGIIGPNGAGKTTLFNLISGAIRPTEGVIFFKGEDIARFKPYEICWKGISRTYQTIRIFPNLTVIKNVLVGLEFGRKNQAFNPTGIVEEGRRLLKFVGLSEKEEGIAQNLNMVERKRLEIARALSTSPELILFDEVIAGLNPSEIQKTMQLIREINKQGITVIMIEHVMKAIMGLSERVMVLHHGEKIAEGNPQEISNDVNVINAYLGKTH